MMIDEKHNRQSIRYPGYDYSQPGHYFVTICTKDRECVFGEINNGVMGLSEMGIMANKFWLEIPKHFLNVRLDEYVIMPNHVHGIIEIPWANDDVRSFNRGVVGVGVQNFEPLPFTERHHNEYQHIIPCSLGSIIRGFKIGVTKWGNQNGRKNPIWQRNFYDRIINTDEQLEIIRYYIRENTHNWDNDCNNPKKFKLN